MDTQTPTVEASPTGLAKSDLSLLHLQVELVQIDIRLMHAVRRWQQTQQNQNGERILQPHYISDEEIETLLKQPLGGVGQAMPAQGSFADMQTAAAKRAELLRKTARQRGKILRLDYLVEAFELSRFERDALLIALAPALDRRYERFYGYLQDDATRKWPSVNLILDLLRQPGPDRLLHLPHFSADGPLLKSELLIPVKEPGMVEPPLLNQALRPDRTVVNWLLGKYQPKLPDFSRLVWPGNQQLAADKLLTKELLPSVQRLMAQKEQSLLVFYGRDAGAQQAAARQLAAQLERPLLLFDFAAALKIENMAPLQTLRFALRDARLTGAVPYLFGWDACLEDGAPPPQLLAELYNFTGPVMVASRQRWHARGINREHHLLWFKFPLPSYVQRQAIWDHYLQQANLSGSFDVDSLASQFSFTSGQIRDAVASGQDLALQRGESLQAEDLFAAARMHSNPRLMSLARRLKPRYYWSDIILPPDQIEILRELVATVRGRPTVLHRWDARRKLVSSAGVTALFAGPPGTGKTMAAEVIARELNLDLYKIDLSTVVSKYIGETEKNLEKIFTEAETSNAILFFDEADALFGKRSEVRDAHDRYANIEISYLLQRMEIYDGVTILATNLRANLDEAFTRRLQFVVDFPFPEEEDRLRIWQTLLPATFPQRDDLDLTLMAHRFKLAGGNIRNIIVSAAYLSASDGGQITMQHLLHGTRRELQKMGRMMNEQDLRVD